MLRAPLLLLLPTLTGCLKELPIPVDTGGVPGDCTWYIDADGDSFGGLSTVGGPCDAAPQGYTDNEQDCDDADASVYPGAPVDCTDGDNNCDGEPDNTDGDGDGFAACEECDDTRPEAFPGADETCNGLDDDCDGEADNDAVDAGIWFQDSDGDGFGGQEATTLSCEQPDGYSVNNVDCDDADGAVHPDAQELCNGVDDDCDGEIDVGASDPSTWYADADNDGFGAAERTLEACERPTGYVQDDQDCDDSEGDVNPDAEELCNGVDDDCDGEIDEADAADASTWYADADADGYGDASRPTVACDQPDWLVADSSDCDDTDAAINPVAQEVCDSIDNDCDGAIDDDDSSLDSSTGTLWHLDSDGDGYGNPSRTTQTCTLPSGYVSDDTDCDDGRSQVNPGATEVCNDRDDDCDGSVDDNDSSLDTSTASTWYTDGDGDGFGDSSSSGLACDQPGGMVADDTDCDDSDTATYPGATEYCDGHDDDCDGDIDESDAADADDWYADSDGDSFGDPNSSVPSCNQPSGYLADDTDCDDTDAAINPNGTETCDGQDEDCDGVADDGFPDTDGDGVNDCLDDCPVYADGGLNANGDGGANDPYQSINDAITLRGGFCDEILLLPGSFHETVDYAGQDLSIVSTSGAAVTTVGQLSTSSTSFGSIFTFTNGETSAALLEGVTITAGTGTSGSFGNVTGSGNHGGGVYISSADPTIRDCVFDGNRTRSGYGGGLAAYDYDGLLEGNQFLGNRAQSGGGGVALADSDAVLVDNTFSGNTVDSISSGWGGGLMVSGGSPLVDSNQIEGNYSRYGGGVMLAGATADVFNNVLADNAVHNVTLEAADASNLMNNTLYGGSISLSMYDRYGTPTSQVVNNIISDYGATGVYSSGVTTSDVSWQYNDVYSSSSWTSDYLGALGSQDGSGGNVDVDPSYVDEGAGDFRLSGSSTLIDLGTNTTAYGVTTDFNGVARPTGASHDMGAFEQ